VGAILLGQMSRTLVAAQEGARMSDIFFLSCGIFLLALDIVSFIWLAWLSGKLSALSGEPKRKRESWLGPVKAKAGISLLHLPSDYEKSERERSENEGA
jgi:hypothetical protein